jgi:hypothetical protein
VNAKAVLAALGRTLGCALFFALGGGFVFALIGLLYGFLCGAVIGLILWLLNSPFADETLTIGSVIGVSVGAIGGISAFALGGIIQGIRLEMKCQFPQDASGAFDRCMQQALRASVVLGTAGGLTGAFCGALAHWQWRNVMPLSEFVLDGFAVGNGAGYFSGLLLGAVAPGVVEKARQRVAAHFGRVSGRGQCRAPTVLLPLRNTRGPEQIAPALLN